MYNLRSISIDRIDYEKGYIKENVQLVCKWANLAKGSHPNEEMKNIIDEIRSINQ